tara:strand:+ start:5703 stop:5885 length:183 start_codon:yes stop_codon:yes gene_type:complete
MSDILSIVTAVLFANILTILFAWGCVRASRIYDDNEADIPTILALIIPLFVAAGGAYIYL